MSLTLCADQPVHRPSAALEASAPIQAEPARGDPVYNDFYRTGGWKYSYWKEFLWHRRHLVKRFGLHRGMRVLEVACGNGFHTNLLRLMGFDCLGVDRSREGIAWARSRFPRSRYHCGDLFGELPLARSSCEVVFARGCSHYHYDLMSAQAIDTTRHLLGYLKPGGVFVMVIVTNLSGSKEAGQIWHNTLDDYRRHFGSFESDFSVGWVDGMAVCGLWKSA